MFELWELRIYDFHIKTYNMSEVLVEGIGDLYVGEDRVKLIYLIT